MQRMSEAEQEIMQFVWSSGSSVTSAELLEALKQANKGWKPNTVLTFLARLTEKGIVKSVKHGRINEYLPLVSQAEYKQFETRQFLESVHGGSVKNFITALCAEDVSAQEIRELKEWFSKLNEEEQSHG